MAGKVVAEEYRSALADLVFNSKPMINYLTMLADENIEYGSLIIPEIKTRIEKVSNEHKMPALYLLDSILKNIGKDYVQNIGKHIVFIFTHVFEMAKDERKRMLLFKLRNTWTQHFPSAILRELDTRVQKIDPNWPIHPISTTASSAVAGGGTATPTNAAKKKPPPLTATSPDGSTTGNDIPPLAASTPAVMTTAASSSGATPTSPTSPSQKIHINPKFLKKQSVDASSLMSSIAAEKAELEVEKLKAKIREQRLLEEEKRVQEQLKLLQSEKARQQQKQLNEERLRKELLLRKQTAERERLISEQKQQIEVMRKQQGGAEKEATPSQQQHRQVDPRLRKSASSSSNHNTSPSTSSHNASRSVQDPRLSDRHSNSDRSSRTRTPVVVTTSAPFKPYSKPAVATATTPRSTSTGKSPVNILNKIMTNVKPAVAAAERSRRQPLPDAAAMAKIVEENAAKAVAEIKKDVTPSFPDQRVRGDEVDKPTTPKKSDTAIIAAVQPVTPPTNAARSVLSVDLSATIAQETDMEMSPDVSPDPSEWATAPRLQSVGQPRAKITIKPMVTSEPDASSSQPASSASVGAPVAASIATSVEVAVSTSALVPTVVPVGTKTPSTMPLSTGTAPAVPATPSSTLRDAMLPLAGGAFTFEHLHKFLSAALPTASADNMSAQDIKIAAQAAAIATAMQVMQSASGDTDGTSTIQHLLSSFQPQIQRTPQRRKNSRGESVEQFIPVAKDELTSVVDLQGSQRRRSRSTSLDRSAGGKILSPEEKESPDEPPSKRRCSDRLSRDRRSISRENESGERSRKARARSPSRYHNLMVKKIESDKRVEDAADEMDLARFSRSPGGEQLTFMHRGRPNAHDRFTHGSDVESRKRRKKEFQSLRTRITDLFTRQTQPQIDSSTCRELMQQIHSKFDEGEIASGHRDLLLTHINDLISSSHEDANTVLPPHPDSTDSSAVPSTSGAVGQPPPGCPPCPPVPVHLPGADNGPLIPRPPFPPHPPFSMNGPPQRLPHRPFFEGPPRPPMRPPFGEDDSRMLPFPPLPPHSNEGPRHRMSIYQDTRPRFGGPRHDARPRHRMERPPPPHGHHRHRFPMDHGPRRPMDDGDMMMRHRHRFPMEEGPRRPMDDIDMHHGPRFIMEHGPRRPMDDIDMPMHHEPRFPMGNGPPRQHIEDGVPGPPMHHGQRFPMLDGPRLVGEQRICADSALSAREQFRRPIEGPLRHPIDFVRPPLPPKPMGLMDVDIQTLPQRITAEDSSQTDKPLSPGAQKRRFVETTKFAAPIAPPVPFPPLPPLTELQPSASTVVESHLVDVREDWRKRDQEEERAFEERMLMEERRRQGVVTFDYNHRAGHYRAPAREEGDIYMQGDMHGIQRPDAQEPYGWHATPQKRHDFPAQQPQVAASPMDILSLLGKLAAAGMIPQQNQIELDQIKKEEEIEEQQMAPMKEEDIEEEDCGLSEVPEMRLVIGDLRHRHEAAIDCLFRGLQCSTCGHRFQNDSSRQRYRMHLDWHFRTNRKDKVGAGRPESRTWFFNVDDWLNADDVIFQEGEASAVSDIICHEAEKKAKNAMSELIRMAQGLLPSQEQIEDSQSCVVTGAPGDDFCSVCLEHLEQFWDEEGEEWRYRQAVRENDRTFHFDCFQDANPLDLEDAYAEAEVSFKHELPCTPSQPATPILGTPAREFAFPATGIVTSSPAAIPSPIDMPSPYQTLSLIDTSPVEVIKVEDETNPASKMEDEKNPVSNMETDLEPISKMETGFEPITKMESTDLEPISRMQTDLEPISKMETALETISKMEIDGDTENTVHDLPVTANRLPVDAVAVDVPDDVINVKSEVVEQNRTPSPVPATVAEEADMTRDETALISADRVAFPTFDKLHFVAAEEVGIVQNAIPSPTFERLPISASDATLPMEKDAATDLALSLEKNDTESDEATAIVELTDQIPLLSSDTLTGSTCDVVDSDVMLGRETEAEDMLNEIVDIEPEEIEADRVPSPTFDMLPDSTRTPLSNGTFNMDAVDATREPPVSDAPVEDCAGEHAAPVEWAMRSVQATGNDAPVGDSVKDAVEDVVTTPVEIMESLQATVDDVELDNAGSVSVESAANDVKLPGPVSTDELGTMSECGTFTVADSSVLLVTVTEREDSASEGGQLEPLKFVNKRRDEEHTAAVCTGIAPDQEEVSSGKNNVAVQHVLENNDEDLPKSCGNEKQMEDEAAVEIVVQNELASVDDLAMTAVDDVDVMSATDIDVASVEENFDAEAVDYPSLMAVKKPNISVYSTDISSPARVSDADTPISGYDSETIVNLSESDSESLNKINSSVVVSEANDLVD